MKPYFRVGDGGELAGVHWRVLQGEKTRSDMVIQLRTDGWVKSKMAVAFLLSDFHYQVEDILRDEKYLPPGSLGGEYFGNMLRCSWQAGWQWAAGRTEAQRTQRRAA